MDGELSCCSAVFSGVREISVCSFGHLQFRSVFNGGERRGRGVDFGAVSLVFMAQLKIAALKQAIISLPLPLLSPTLLLYKMSPLSLPYLCSPLCISTPTHSPISNSPVSRSPPSLFISQHCNLADSLCALQSCGSH